jgi:hypothetical protein
MTNMATWPPCALRRGQVTDQDLRVIAGGGGLGAELADLLVGRVRHAEIMMREPCQGKIGPQPRDITIRWRVATAENHHSGHSGRRFS